jgi:hypothetical protein
MDAVMALDARHAPLEYWFFKLNVPGLAILVDLIARPTDAEVRVSYWQGSRGQVVRAFGAASAEGGIARVGACDLGPRSSSGAAGPVEWTLRYEAGPRVVDPGRFTRLIRPFDLELLSVPGTVFSGEVIVDGRRFAIDGAPGLLAHYWGARLPPRWHWVSVNVPGLDLDGVITDSRLWGLPGPTLRAGYLYIADGTRQSLVISPLNGLVRARQDDQGLVVDALAPGAPRVTARFSADPTAFNDLGMNISQTLVGDCEIAGRRIAGVAGIEQRS